MHVLHRLKQHIFTYILNHTVGREGQKQRIYGPNTIYVREGWGRAWFRPKLQYLETVGLNFFCFDIQCGHLILFIGYPCWLSHWLRANLPASDWLFGLTWFYFPLRKTGKEIERKWGGNLGEVVGRRVGWVENNKS